MTSAPGPTKENGITPDSADARIKIEGTMCEFRPIRLLFAGKINRRKCGETAALDTPNQKAIPYSDLLPCVPTSLGNHWLTTSDTEISSGSTDLQCRPD